MLNKFYHLLDCSPSHNQLLFRSYDSKNGVNHDLLFEGVDFIAMPLCFHLIGIKQKTNVQLPESVVLHPHTKTLCLEFENGEGFVRLYRISYQVNSLPPTETSIPIKREKPLTHEDIMEIAEAVKRSGYEEWQKLHSKNDWKKIF
jgi:hypothetical protein